MKKEQKAEIVNDLSEALTAAQNFYIADISTLTVNQANELRRLCFQRGIRLQVVKNTLIRKALEQANIQDEALMDSLKGFSSLMISESINGPAKLIKEFRVKHSRPVLKAAYVQESVFIGDDNIETLIKLKSREELIGGIISLLQSPAANVISALQGQGGKVAGILKTLSEREQA